MQTRRALAQQLGVVAGFEEPTAALEQYPTPPELAATLIHTADLRGDIDGRTIIDLGTGTGMLLLGAALRSPTQGIGVDIDRGALVTAKRNERRLSAPPPLTWLQADVRQLSLAAEQATTTVVMNPPFGAQQGNKHADRAFLEVAGNLAAVSYSVHNAGSRSFIDSFVTDHDGQVTDAFATEISLDRQFSFHTDTTTTIDAEVYRIAWD